VSRLYFFDNDSQTRVTSQIDTLLMTLARF
jgi:hypothetical protein